MGNPEYNTPAYNGKLRQSRLAKQKNLSCSHIVLFVVELYISSGMVLIGFTTSAAHVLYYILYPPPCLRHEKRVRGTPLVSQLFSDLELSVLLF